MWRLGTRSLGDGAPACREVLVHMHRRHPAIVESGASHGAPIEIEAERLDEMQFGACVGAQANDVAGVGRDLGLEQYDAKHGGSVRCVMHYDRLLKRSSAASSRAIQAPSADSFRSAHKVTDAACAGRLENGTLTLKLRCVPRSRVASD